ncbi:MAG: TIGR04211 family SH3 domain-containing protein [Proteobacteria bacterium]|nr:TIGR04211 family SH3 domain-containing protein [Pseudomonadota bacterium]
MRNTLSIIFGLLVLLATSSATWAATTFVTDRVRVIVYSGPGNLEPVLGEIKTGDEVELLEKQAAHSKIKLNAMEGWVESKYLRKAKPAAVKLKEARKELNDVKLELRNVTDKAMIMEKQMGSVSQQRDLAQQTQASNEETLTNLREAVAAAETRATMAEAGISIGWIIACIVALAAGFGAGIWWEREQNRKKLGGMKIRIRGI